MRNGLGAGPLPLTLLYAAPIQQACVELDFSPLVAYAIACNETIIGEVSGKWNAATVLSADGGHGLFQLTSSWPAGWEDPYLNARFAVSQFLKPAEAYWVSHNAFQGEKLMRAIAASFNAGIGGAESGHIAGDLDKFTTDRYAARALALYQKLFAGKAPY